MEIEKNKSREKANWYEKICLINKKCYLSSVVYYHKGNVIQAPLEALITFYIAESLVFFSGYFVKESFDTISTLTIIFVPLIFSILVCIGYSILAILTITNKLYNCLRVIEEKSIAGIAAYEYIDQNIKSVFKSIHKLGAALYTLVAYAVSQYCIVKLEIDEPIKFTVIVVLIGLFYGALWNLKGYNGDRRVEWSQVVIELSELSLEGKKDIVEGKYKNFMARVTLDVIGVVTILGLALLVLFRPHPFIGNANDIQLIYLYVSLFAMSMFTYIKYTVSHFYFRKSDTPKIYVNIYDFHNE